jgi:hypothetical protein
VAIMRHGCAAETLAKRCVTDTTALFSQTAGHAATDRNVTRSMDAVYGRRRMEIRRCATRMSKC